MIGLIACIIAAVKGHKTFAWINVQKVNVKKLWKE